MNPEFYLVIVIGGLFTLSFVAYVFGRVQFRKSTIAEKRSAAIRDHSRDAVFSLSENGIITEANPASLTLLCADSAQICNRPVDDFIVEFISLAEALSRGAKTDPFAWFPFLRQHLGLNCQGVMRRSDGSTFPVEFFIQRIGISREFAYFAHLSDISERCRMEEELRRERNFIASVLEVLPSLVIVYNKDGKIIEFNRACEDLSGYHDDEVRGKSLATLFLPPEIRDEVFQQGWLAVATEKEQLPLQTEHEWLTRTGERRLITWTNTANFDTQGEFLFGIASGLDITEQRAAERELRKKEKLESISLLAGGIAHDFNNILTALIGNLSLARAEAKKDKSLENRLEEAEKASLRARNLARQLLNFVKEGSPLQTTVGLSKLIRETVQFTLRGSNVRADFKLPENLAPVKVDPGQISQIFENLTINAVQAMPEGGIITISGKDLTPESIPERDDIPTPLAAKYVAISFTDSGSGMEPGVMKRIFQPYFTTKSRGTGLGLTTCYSIAKNHLGLLTVSSQLGLGTTFILYLPASTEKIENSGEELVEKPLSSGSGKILVVDDEKPILLLLEETLTSFGYQYAGASDGPAGVKAYEKAHAKGEPFDLVIMDLTIPGEMSGLQAMARIHEIDPKAKGIISTGYSQSEIMRDYTKHGFQGAIAKPYNIQELLTAIQKILRP